MSQASDIEVFVVVLNWNGWKDTIECLESLQQLAYSNFRMVVVDNGSDDGSTERIENWAKGCQLANSPHVVYQRANKPLSVISYGKLEAEAGGIEETENSLSGIPSDRVLVLVRTGTNLGFAGGCNVGIRYAMKRGAEYVWLLNNDTIVDPKALSEMVALARANVRVGLVGSVLRHYHDPRVVQAHGGGYISWWWGTAKHVLEGQTRRLDYLTGASLLIKRQVIEAVGLLDESYFFYWEDITYSRRALEAGWEIAVADGSRVLHKEGGTVSGGGRIKTLTSDRFMVRGMILFFRTYGGLCWPLAVLLRLIGVVINRLRRGQADRVPSLLKVAWAAYREPLSTRPNTPTLVR